MSARSRSAVDAVEYALDNVCRFNGQLSAVVTVMADSARDEARRLDQLSRDGQATGLLHGIPITVKDNIWTAGTRTTSGSDLFRDFVPDVDAEVVRRLRDAGAVMVGKTNLHELACGATTQNPHYGNCRNPWDPDRVPGGSSGGAGAAVASEMCLISIGTDTGGSVRIPAALNGLVGLRPTTRGIPTGGVTPLSARYDTVGPMAYSVDDVARCYVVLAGCDDFVEMGRWDDRSLSLLHTFDALKSNGKWPRVGVPSSFYFDDIDEQIYQAVQRGLRELEQLGCEVVEVRLPGAEDAQEEMTKIVLAEVASYYRDHLQESRASFGRGIYELLIVGTEMKAYEYVRAMQFAEEWRQTVHAAFEHVDVIVSPTVPILAPLINEASESSVGADDVPRILPRLTYGWALAEIPALTVPCGMSRGGLPIGMQFASAPRKEGLLLALGQRFQSRTNWHKNRPPMLGCSLT